VYTYRAEVLLALERHGIRPAPHTRPELVRDFVRDLYTHEIRALRSGMLNGEFPRREYPSRVDALRGRYAVLALQPQQFLVA
jgi:hypothetical protein